MALIQVWKKFLKKLEFWLKLDKCEAKSNLLKTEFLIKKNLGTAHYESAVNAAQAKATSNAADKQINFNTAAAVTEAAAQAGHTPPPNINVAVQA